MSVSTNFAIEPTIKPIDAMEPNNITIDRCVSVFPNPVATMPLEFKRDNMSIHATKSVQLVKMWTILESIFQ